MNTLYLQVRDFHASIPVEEGKKEVMMERKDRGRKRGKEQEKVDGRMEERKKIKESREEGTRNDTLAIFYGFISCRVCNQNLQSN